MNMLTVKPYLQVVFCDVFLLAIQAQVPPHCIYSIGMEKRNIADLRISASGFLSPTFAPSKARLNIDNGRYDGEAWKPMVSNSMQWIKVDMRVPVLVTGVKTQGRKGSGEFVSEYVVKYSNDGKNWTDIWQPSQLNKFMGNTDDHSVVTNYFKKGVKVRFIMIVPVRWMRHIALRFELTGCPECYILTNARDYRGSINTTLTGKTCQRWTSQTPHGHGYKPEKFPNGGLGDHNMCRNVGDHSHTWCYTTNRKKRWENCDIGSAGEYCGDEELLVRLVDGNTTLEGRVEVFFDGMWGTICGDSFGSSDAKVICKMLGYQKTDSNQCCKSFGPGSGKIFIDDLECLGHEDSLEQCRHSGWGEHNCRHQEDVGITCKQIPTFTQPEEAMKSMKLTTTLKIHDDVSRWSVSQIFFTCAVAVILLVLGLQISITIFKRICAYEHRSRFQLPQWFSKVVTEYKTTSLPRQTGPTEVFDELKSRPSSGYLQIVLQEQQTKTCDTIEDQGSEPEEEQIFKQDNCVGNGVILKDNDYIQSNFFSHMP